MGAEDIIVLLVAPIALGFGLGVVEQRAFAASRVLVVAMGLAIAAIYLLHEGLPPFPAISAKHKIAYALAALPVFGLVAFNQASYRRAALLAIVAAITFIWLVQRPLTAGRFDWGWLLPLGTIAVWMPMLAKAPDLSRSPFTSPVAHLAMSMTASVLALLGGFLGLGQVLLSLSALLGGYALSIFVVTLQYGTPKSGHPMMIWTVQGGLLILFVQLSTFATNLSTAAYLLLLTLAALPFVDAKLSRLPLLVQPFAFAALALMAGIPAMLLALRNF